MHHRTSQLTGRKIALSSSRRFINDLMHFSKKLPLVSVEKRISLLPLIAARKQAINRPSWFVIFLKALAIVTARHPLMRRSYLSFPRPHLYEDNQTSALLAMERQVDGEAMILFAKVYQPQQLSLFELDKIIKEYKEKPILELPSFRRSLRVNKLPWPLRRLAWWLGLNVASFRKRFFGNFAVTGVPNLGAATVNLLSPISVNLTFGVFDDDGSVNVRLHWDHRIFDGVFVAEVLDELAGILNREIVDELQFTV